MLVGSGWGQGRESGQDTRGHHPYSCDECPGIFSDHRESGHRFNVSSGQSNCLRPGVLGILHGPEG